MVTSGAKHPLQAEKPKVIVIGDCVVDCHIYDKRDEDADQWLAWTSPLSRDDWHYAAGFEMRQCLAGAAAIHAMLHTNGIPVAGNSFPIADAFLSSQETGSIFVLRRRAKAGRETWRAAASFLSKSGKAYIDGFDRTKAVYETGALKAVCLWDLGRGYFQPPTEGSKWEAQQEQLLHWYKGLCSAVNKPPILIRTSDPGNFAHFLKALADDPDGAPKVVLVCGQAQIYDGDLRGSGTWSGVWRQTYDHLNLPAMAYLADADDWRFNVVIPVYEDGVIWIGPGCWPFDPASCTSAHLHNDKRPMGKLFLVPGMQPGLSEFEEHSRIIGVHALLTYSILEQLADAPTAPDISPAIKRGLMRCRRLRSEGYCPPEKLSPIDEDRKTVHINYQRETWKKEHRDATDVLLEVNDPQAGQNAGPYEVRCLLPKHVDTASPTRIFRTVEKAINGEFVASPSNCYWVVKDVRQESIGDSIDIHGKQWPLDSVAKDQIETFRLRQRISMQFGDFAMANPKDAAPILDLAQRVRQHVLVNRYNSPDKGSVFNFALFGSPGSGKSFLAREIARLVDAKGDIFNVDEVNLSQFSEPAQLARELDVIASKSVGGKVPLVLWDEFDSVLDGKRGGWLARFLMPMQDAHFFDGRQRRPIGTAVFVFIGGTFPTAREFRGWACEAGIPGKDPPDAVLLKARDFHSRLYSALDMPSIVEIDESASSASGVRCQTFKTEWENNYTKLARAVLLRQYFRKKSKIGKKTVFLKTVEEDLCKFLLAIPLRHGARSLERIVEACLVSKPARVSMLHLPPDHFLAEHIETENVRRDGQTGTGMTIDAMRDACH